MKNKPACKYLQKQKPCMYGMKKKDKRYLKSTVSESHHGITSGFLFSYILKVWHFERNSSEWTIR